MEVSRPVFKAVMLDGTRVEEGWTIQLINENGEPFEGVITKLEAKKITIQSEGETFERAFGIASAQRVKVISEEVPE